jgi:hypothetical protein
MDFIISINERNQRRRTMAVEKIHIIFRSCQYQEPANHLNRDEKRNIWKMNKEKGKKWNK